MILVDSSGWLEYLGGGPQAGSFAPALESRPANILVPAICLYEVYKRILLLRSEDEALTAVGIMMRSSVEEISSQIALRGAELSVEHHLHMADSLILATAQFHEAELWTMDADFAGLPGVRYFKR